MYVRKNPNGTINTNMKGKTNAVIGELKAKLNTRRASLQNGEVYTEKNTTRNANKNKAHMNALRIGSNTGAKATIPTYKPFEATPYIKVSGLQKNTKRLSCTTANSGKTYTCTPAGAGGGKTRKSTRR
jgi:hypothetical protein